MIGCEVNQDEQVELILHLKNAFHMEEDRHRQLLETATMREVRLKLYILFKDGINNFIIYNHRKYLFSIK